MLLVSVWVHGYLGGIGFAAPDGSNTDQLFNWHPILMTFAFAVLMTEAVLAYRAPWQSQFSRPLKKQVHWILHSSALVLGFFGFLAAYKSHTLKIPPIANFYSPHSFIGSAALLLFLGQYVIGFVSYLYPQTAIEKRVALGPFHRFYGLAVYCTGMAAAAIGLQEKATFIQVFGKKDVYSGYIRLPAVTELLLVTTVLMVLWQYAQPGAAGRRQAVQYAVVGTTDEEAATLQ